MQLPGSRGQMVRDLTFDASGTIATGGTAQLLLPEHKARSFLFIQNLDSTHDLYIEFGAARAHAVLTSGVVTSVVVDNAGFGYTYPPNVEFLGGGNSGNTAFLGVAAPLYPAPGDPGDSPIRFTDFTLQKVAKAHATLGVSSISGSLVNAIVIEDGGKGYQTAPLVRITNSLRDPYGVAIPSTTSGMWLSAGGGNLYINGPYCMTDQISVYGGTTSQAYCCKYA